MRWDLHGLVIEGEWSDAAIGERWRATFASRPVTSAPADLSVSLALADTVPAAPTRPPDFEQGDLLAYYLNETAATGGSALAHFPRYGQLRLDFADGSTQGCLTEAALATYGVFEDLLAISLSPHLRRRGRFLLHAFAAVPPEPSGRAVLLVGDIGAGKTTTGLALLHAGWRLLSNDSPILADERGLRVLAYPGLLSAYPATLASFPELALLNTAPDQHRKVLFAAESIYPGVWAEAAIPGALLFPYIERRAEHALERLPAPEALRLILPHAIEQWDRALIPPHLALLNGLVQAAPAYRLRLAPDLTSLPQVIAASLRA